MTQDLNAKLKQIDFVALSASMQKAMNRIVPLIPAMAEKQSEMQAKMADDPFNIKGAYTEYMLGLIRDPQHALELQSEFWKQWTDVWQNSVNHITKGEIQDDVIKPQAGDRRFRSNDWTENAVFDFIKQSYLLTCKCMQDSIEKSEDLSDEEKHKLGFHTEVFLNSLSPSNFAATNPDVINEAVNTCGESLVAGMNNLIGDLERGKGDLKISLTDYDAFKAGENLAMTKGRVVEQTSMMQLIQYAPTTKQVYEKPILFVPPWINKYYILDMREDNSMIKWLVDQGFTVFVISWVNPDESMADKKFEDYMEDGVFKALDSVEKITGQKGVNAVGYCIGGTLLSIILAYMAAKGTDDRISSATFFTSLMDFENAGDLKLFTEESQIESLEADMEEKGFLEARKLQMTFSMLRSNDLIWSFVVNNYLMGKEPFPFDLLYWNDDSTNLPAAMQSFYLRNMYLENNLRKKGGITIAGQPIDLGKIKTPAYFLSTREDHIAPWIATYEGTQLLGGDNTFVLSGSGHIAGVINPPVKNKYSYWTNTKLPKAYADWDKSAKETKGTWWPNWSAWLGKKSGKKVDARNPAKGIEAAPGSYVTGE